MTGGAVPARPEGHAGLPSRPRASTSGWTGGRIAAAVIGGLLVLLAVALLGAAGVGFWADLSQREGGYVTPGGHHFSTSGSALVTEETKLGSAGVGWLYPSSLLGKIRIRVTPMGPTSPPLFVGIGRTADVERYLAGTNHTVITDYFDEKVQFVGGGPVRSAPATQRFWVASATGSGRQSVVWKAKDGSWSVVVMRADGRPGMAVHADLGARIPSLRWVAIGVSVAGLVFLAGGALLIMGVIRRRPSATP